MDTLNRSSMLTPARLQASWQATLSRQPRPGPDGLSLAQFAQDADARLHRLHAAVQSDAYRPAAAWRTWIAKPNGGERAVIALGLQDRIVEGALLSGIRTVAERHLHPAAFAYREGLGALRAVSELLRRRAEGLTWVVRGDVSACFDSIPHGPLIDSLGLVLAPCAQLTVYRTLNRPVIDRGRPLTLTRGVPQGGLLSPLLANWYLRAFDERISRAGGALVRYADDFVVAAHSPVQAAELLAEAQAALHGLQLSLNPGKTRVVSFADGFDFLGFQISDRGVRVSPDRLRAFQEQMTALLGQPGGPNLQAANDLLRGWRAYFSIGQVRDDFQVLESWLQAQYPSCWPSLRRLLPDRLNRAGAAPAVLGGYTVRRQPRVQRSGTPNAGSPVPTGTGQSVPPAPPVPGGREAPLGELRRARAELVVAAWTTHPSGPARAAALLAQRLHEGSFGEWSGLSVAVRAANRALCGPSADLAAGVARAHLNEVTAAACALAGLHDAAVRTALTDVLTTALIELALPHLIATPGPIVSAVDAALTRPLGDRGGPLNWRLVLYREAGTLARALHTGRPYRWRQP